MIAMERWAEIRHLHIAEGLSQRAIARRRGLHRKTVWRAIHAVGPARVSTAATRFPRRRP